MNEARPYASLSSGLLARKGSAKPAMRPQGYTGFEDLGWNDMGLEPREERPVPVEHVPSSIAALTPARGGRPILNGIDAAPVAEPEDEAPEPQAPKALDASEVEPPVVAQQRAILETFDAEEAAPAEPAPRPIRAKIVPLPARAPAVAGRKAAFTLRLDPDRHMRLRLACAVLGRSAQQIVTVALDEALADIPEIDALASRVPAGAKRN